MRLRERDRARAGVLRGEAGFTVVELLVAIGVLLVAVLASFSSQLTSLNLMGTSRETNVAMTDLRTAMEDVMAVHVTNIPLQFPEGAPMGAYTDANLTNERIVPSYPGLTTNPEAADPLNIVLTITWNDFRGRPRTLELATMKTR